MFNQYREIVLCDFEFGAEAGGRQVPVCLVAHELRSGRKYRLWRDEFGARPPYSTGPDTLFAAFYASAEIGCHLALGWPVPERVLDLFIEFRCLTNGRHRGRTFPHRRPDPLRTRRDISYRKEGDAGAGHRIGPHRQAANPARESRPTCLLRDRC
jgi:hypothetical protein